MKTVFDLTAHERRGLQKLTMHSLQQRNAIGDIAIGEEATRKRKADPSALFGNYLDDLPVIYIEQCGYVPLFLYHCVTALSQFIHLEGLFRKAGSIQRQKELRSCVEQGRPVDIGDISLAYDTACLIKQFLRELPEPIFTDYLASCFLQCAHSAQTVLQLALLLPVAHVSTLKYICRFLKQVSDQSEQNKMSVRNLALVFSPSLFPNEPIRLSNAARPSFESSQFHNQILVLEVLISNADSLGVIPSDFTMPFEPLCPSSKASDDESSQSASCGSGETLDSIECKDATRCRKRKSRGSFHGIFSEISHSLSKLRRTSVTKENVAPKFEHDSFADTLIKEISVCVPNHSQLDEKNSVATESILKATRRSITPQRRMSVEKFEVGAQVVRFRKSLDSQPAPQCVPSTVPTPTASATASASATPALVGNTSTSLHVKRRTSDVPRQHPAESNAVNAPWSYNRPSASGNASPKRPFAHITHTVLPSQLAAEFSTPKVKPQMANVDMLISKTAFCRALQASTDRKRACLTHDDRRPAVQVNLL